MRIFNLCFILLTIHSILLFDNTCHGQCGPTLIEPNCAIPGAIELFDGATIASGQTYVVTAPLTINSMTLNGGTLIVCSTLNVNLFTFSGGDLTVVFGGQVNVTNGGAAMVLGSNCNIYNFGVFNSSCSMVTGANNLIYNYSDNSIFNIPFNQLVVQGPNTQVINNGTLNASYIINQSANTIFPFCLGPGSQTTTSIMINQYANGFFVPQGSACIGINNTIINSQIMSDSSGAFICYFAPSVNIIGSPLFGNATVDSGCSGCTLYLAADDLVLNATLENDLPKLTWAGHFNQCDLLQLDLERSNGLEEFKPIASFQFADSTDLYRNEFVDLSAKMNTHYYYRLRAVDVDFTSNHSNVTHVFTQANNRSCCFPNPSTNHSMDLKAGIEVKALIDEQGKSVDYLIESNRLFAPNAAGTYRIIYEYKNEILTETLIFTK